MVVVATCKKQRGNYYLYCNGHTISSWGVGWSVTYYCLIQELLMPIPIAKWVPRNGTPSHHISSNGIQGSSFRSYRAITQTSNANSNNKEFRGMELSHHTPSNGIQGSSFSNYRATTGTSTLTSWFLFCFGGRGWVVGRLLLGILMLDHTRNMNKGRIGIYLSYYKHMTCLQGNTHGTGKQWGEVRWCVG